MSAQPHRWRPLLAVALTLAAGIADARIRMFSYDPADAETKAAAGPLTFAFNQGLLKVRLLSVHATEAQATADLRPAGEKVLGPGGLDALIGKDANERDLYQVLPAEEGAALIAAFCPGAAHAWMAFSRPRLFQDLRIYVIGDGGAAKPTHICRRLDFSFHGEWKLPPTGKFDERELPQDQFPRS
jgi:hypothetical protein